jgi:Uncharacterized protein conserved in bacteria (DUF2188)
MATKQYTARYVRPTADGGWDVIREGHRRPTAHAPTQAEAVEAARKIARREGGGEIRVVNEYGKLVDTDSVQPSLLRALVSRARPN